MTQFISVDHPVSQHHPRCGKDCFQTKADPLYAGVACPGQVQIEWFIRAGGVNLPYCPKNLLGGMPTVRVTMALKALALA
jgi:hypothetical protein